MRLAIDIGGMSTKICVLNGLDIIARELIEYESISAPKLYEKILPVLEGMITKYEIDYIGFASPGVINPTTGEVSGLSAISDREKINFKVLVNKKFNIPVFVENDANCAGIAEMVYGSGKDYDDAAFLIVGTGLGGTIFLNKKIFRGKKFTAGELGCMLTKYTEDKKFINASEFGGMNALETKYFAATNVQKTGQEIYDLYGKDENATGKINLQIFNLAKLIINTAFVIDPEIVIIGGAVSENPLFIRLLKEKLNELFEKSGMTQHFVLTPCQFHNDANIIGASVLDEQV